MPEVPNSLTLRQIVSGTEIRSQPIRDNYSEIQTEFNKVVAILSGGSVGQYLHKDAPNSATWANMPPKSLPAGIIAPFGGGTPPTGWLLCDGAAVSRTTYSALFNVIGTTYGAGDGSTTFNLPDLRGRIPYGRGTHADVDALNDNEGLAVGSRRPGHSHSVSISQLDTRGADTLGTSNTQTVTSTTDSPAFITLNYIIKT